MKKEHILEYLCVYDKRNPNYFYVAPEDQNEEPLTARYNCYCDNCFYGRDKLAVELLRQLELNQKGY